MLNSKVAVEMMSKLSGGQSRGRTSVGGGPGGSEAKQISKRLKNRMAELGSLQEAPKPLEQLCDCSFLQKLCSTQPTVTPVMASRNCLPSFPRGQLIHCSISTNTKEHPRSVLHALSGVCVVSVTVDMQGCSLSFS